MKKRIAIFGATGMIGSALYAALKDSAHLVLVVRDRSKVADLESRYGGTASHTVLELDTASINREYVDTFPGTDSPTLGKFWNDLGAVDAAVQCMGVINRYTKERSAEMLFINAALPHILSRKLQDQLIHVTTDCVYDGKQHAPYDEASVANPVDLYGLSKLAGEPVEHSLVLRTSMVGPEISGYVALLEWVRTQEGKTIHGFRNALWNGLTTFEFARVCRDIIEHRNEFPNTGLYHIFSNDISKYDMVRKIAEKYRVNATIVPEEETHIDRRLATRFDVCKQLAIPSFDEMLARLP